MATPLELTGERTVPGLPAENYWFRRHEAVYAAVPGLASSAAALPAALVLDAGSGEGYGVSLMAGAFPSAAVVGIDYDEAATRHARRAYGGASRAYVRGLLTRLPLADAVADVVVSLQVIEHIWNPDGYLRELARVCRRGGTVVLSTPNRLTFSPGLGRREQPSNIFHCREYDAAELEESVSRWAPALGTSRLLGLRHGPRLRRWEVTHGSLVAAQLRSPPAEWPHVLERVVASAEAEDFELSGEAVDACLDLVVVLEKSG